MSNGKCHVCMQSTNNELFCDDTGYICTSCLQEKEYLEDLPYFQFKRVIKPNQRYASQQPEESI